MKNIKLFSNLTSAIGEVCETPLVASLETLNEQVLYASSDAGDEVEIIANSKIDGFIDYKKYIEYSPNNEIWYTATSKLTETTSTTGKSSGLHTSLFNTTILSHTFDESTGKGIITFNGNVTKIDNYAFLYCSSLTSIILPNSVTSICELAFQNTKLTSFTIGSKVTSISDTALHKDTLSSITVDSSNVTYNDGNGSNCIIETSTNTLIIGCKNTNIPDSVTSIDNYAFSNCTSLTSVTIPNSVTSIGNYAFSVCSNLTSVTIPNSVTSIGNSAFQYCSKLTSFTIPDSVTSIKDSTFYNCTGLTSITIPDSVTSIGDYAFRDCTNLTSVTIPDSVTTIYQQAFYECTKLTSVTIPDSVTSIGSSAFYNVPKVIYSGTATGSPWGAKEVVTE